MKNMKLSTQLTGGFGLIALILFVGGAVGFYGITQVDQDLGRVLERQLPAAHHISAMIESQIDLQRTGRALLEPAIADQASEKERLHRELDGAWSRAEKGWKSFESLA